MTSPRPDPFAATAAMAARFRAVQAIRDTWLGAARVRREAAQQASNDHERRHHEQLAVAYEQQAEEARS